MTKKGFARDDNHLRLKILVRPAPPFVWTGSAGVDKKEENVLESFDFLPF